MSGKIRPTKGRRGAATKGAQFGRWTVVGDVFNQAPGKPVAPCQCACGTYRNVSLEGLTSGSSLSCGCGRQSRRTHGESKTLLYGVWKSMRNRCERPTVKSYADYGARGIKVCEGWQSWEAFRDWAVTHGYGPNMEIDRRDNDGHYSPENCQFVPRKVNANNKRNVRRLEAFGQSKTISEWMGDRRWGGISKGTFIDRLNHGWPIESAIATPPLPSGVARGQAVLDRVGLNPTPHPDEKQ